MNLKLCRVMVLFGLLSLGACVAYAPYPVSPQQRFDQSWAAAAGAMSDQGVTITSQNRGAGSRQAPPYVAAPRGQTPDFPPGSRELRLRSAGAAQACSQPAASQSAGWWPAT